MQPLFFKTGKGEYFSLRDVVLVRPSGKNSVQVTLNISPKLQDPLVYLFNAEAEALLSYLNTASIRATTEEEKHG